MTLALLALLLQDAADDFLKFKKDSTWTYVELEGDKRTTRILRYVGEEKGVATLEATIQRDGEMKPGRPDTMLWHVDNGHFAWALKKDAKVETILRFHKIDSKKGDTWKVTDGEFKGDVAHLGTSEVKVPAGTYKEAIHLEMKRQEESAQIWLVPKVGLVLIEMRTGEETWRLELREFKEGK